MLRSFEKMPESERRYSIHYGQDKVTRFDLFGLLVFSFTPILNSLAAVFLSIYYGMQWLSKPVDFINNTKKK